MNQESGVGNNAKIKSFTDLFAWKEGHKLVLSIYKVTAKFPERERFGLIDQLRRASVSITSNLPEGFSRHGVKEKTQFYYMALGSLTELQNQILIAKDLEYLEKELFEELAKQTVVVSRLINSLIKGVNKIRS